MTIVKMPLNVRSNNCDEFISECPKISYTSITGILA